MSPATPHRPAGLSAARRRALLNLANLTTPLGLAVALLGGARLRRGPDGLWLGEGYRLGLPVAGAFTIGNVVTTRSSFERLREWGPGVLGHEDRHASQYARLGVLFFPLYAAAAAWSWLRYGHPALGNWFERDAGLVSGGYLASAQEPPPQRTLRPTLERLRRARRRSGDARTGSPDAWPGAGAGA